MSSSNCNPTYKWDEDNERERGEGGSEGGRERGRERERERGREIEREREKERERVRISDVITPFFSTLMHSFHATQDNNKELYKPCLHLHHLHPLIPQVMGETKHINLTLGFPLVQQTVQSYEGSSPANTSTESKYKLIIPTCLHTSYHALTYHTIIHSCLDKMKRSR